MAADVSEIPLPYWLAAHRLLSAPGGAGTTSRELQEQLSLPSRELADRVLNEVRHAMARGTGQEFPTRPAELAANGESWLLADSFWDHNG
jgi:hypothetical protein